MGKVYLNDIDIDIFAKYFNETNYTDSENILMYEEVKIPGTKYTTPIKYKDSPGYSIYTVDKIGKSKSVGETNELNTEKIYMYPCVDGFLDPEDKENPKKSITVPLENVTTTNLLECVTLSFSLKRIHGYTTDNQHIFNNGEFITYDITYDIDDKADTPTVTFTIDTTPNITNELKYKENNVFKDVFKDENIIKSIINSKEVDYVDSETKSAVKSTDIFGNKNMTQLVSVSNSENNENSTILRGRFCKFKIVTYPYLCTVPVTDDNGNYLYKDSNGKLTTLPSYPNRFYKHQKAIRKTFFDIVESGGWQYRVKPETIVLIRKGNKKQLAYYYNINKKISYEYVSELPNGYFTDPNIPTKNIFDNLPSKTEEYRNIVYGDIIDEFPRYRTYITQDADIEGSEFTFDYIEGIDETSFKNIKGKPIILDINTRTIEFIGSSVKYDISSNETINVNVGLGSASLNPSEFTVNNLNGGSPYILLPIISDNNKFLGAEAILSLANINVFIGSMIGKIIVNGYNLSDVYLELGTQKLSVFTSEEVGYNSKDILIGLGGNVESQSIFFFKIPLKEVSVSLKHTVICTFKEYTPAEVKVDEVLEPSFGSTIKDTEDISSSKPLVENVIPPMPIVLKNKDKIVFTPFIDEGVTTKSAGVGGFTMLNPRPNTNFRFSQIAAPMMLTREVESKETTKETKKVITKAKYETKEKQTISYKYSINGESITTYYENPYTTDVSKRYLEKTESIKPTNDVAVTREFGRYIYLYSTDNKKSSGKNELINIFKSDNTYIDDGIEKLRGSLVNEDVFYNNRKNAFKNSLEDILKNDSNNVITPLTEFYKADGKDRMYNYCTSIINIVKEDYRVPEVPKSYSNKVFIDPISDSRKLVLQTVKHTRYAESEGLKTLPFICGVLSGKRSFIQKLAEREKFPIESVYEKYLREKTELENIISRAGELHKINNTNLKYYQKNRNNLKSKYIPSGNYEREMMGSSIANFVLSGAKAFLKFDISDNIIDNGHIIYDMQLNGDSESSTYKKVYINNELTENDLEDIIADLIVPNSDGEIMEVTDVNI